MKQLILLLVCALVSSVHASILIEAEDFDLGGEGVAYHDSDAGNNGGAYRLTTDVDIEMCTDIGGGYNVGWIFEGEWLNYTIDVPAGIYDIEVRVASQSTGGNFHIEFGNVDMTGSVIVPATGGWQNWTTLTIPEITLAGGTQTMTFVNDGGGGGDQYNLNYINLVPEPATMILLGLGGLMLRRKKA